MNWNLLLVLKYVILCCVCVIGDKLSESAQKPALVRACIDNATHAFIGCIVAELVLFNFKHQLTRQEYCWLLFVATIISSCIDLDHFIEAKSFRLQDATNLDRRPFLHNSTICVVIVILFILTKRASNQLRMLIAMAFVAFSTHHLRDATRRGIWFKSPFQDSSSPAVPYVLYIAYVNIIPSVIVYLLQTTGSSTVPKMRLVEVV
uniref:Transmembrane protein 267 n=1 Tax=Anopheles quadriannulatus TaxID=34691 RepID=A0A182XD02_ANOQN